MAEICLCGCPKERHRFSVGSCKDCDCDGFEAREEERTAVVTEDRSPPLESFDAWRCAVCGSRAPRNQRCNVRISCRNRWLDPVRVEIHSREAE